MAACMASKMAVAPSRGALARKTSVKTARRTGLIRVRAVGPAYDEVFDGTTGQMEKVLSQSVESLSAGGLEWSYRVGVPEEVHGRRVSRHPPRTRLRLNKVGPRTES